MTIRREGEFLIDDDRSVGPTIGMESSRLNACVEQAKSSGVLGVFGSPCFDFHEDNLDFLSELTHLQKVWFWDVKLRSVDAIYGLADLRFFGLHPQRPGIDFSRLPLLEEITWVYNAKDRSLGDLARVTRLWLWHYNVKSRSFDGVGVPDRLEEFQILWANPTSLAGLPVFPRLKKLTIARCPNLETLSHLVEIVPNVEHLVVESCGRVKDGADVVSQLPRLRHAFIKDKVLVSRGRQES